VVNGSSSEKYFKIVNKHDLTYNNYNHYKYHTGIIKNNIGSNIEEEFETKQREILYMTAMKNYRN
jgi:hypothetical protein